MKISKSSIEWLVALSIVLITTSRMFTVSMDNLGYPIVKSIVNYIRVIPICIILLYQNKNYGFKIYDGKNLLFYLIYCIYILLDLTALRKMPINTMAAVPASLFVYSYQFFLSIAYFLGAQTIVTFFNIRKFVILSVIICTIPSILLFNYIGVEVLQMGMSQNDQDYISVMAIAFANVPLTVLAVYNYKTLFNDKLLSMVFSSFLIVSGVVIMLISGTRGALLWCVVNIMICYFLKIKKIRKKMIMAGAVVLIFMVAIDPVISFLKDVTPKTAERIENTVKEGDTDARFDLNDPDNSTFLIGLENFSRSPIVGNYFRMETKNRYFRGHYPHNIFIEVLMTMGLIGFIPFMALLYKAYRKCRYLFLKGHTPGQLACLILFLCQFLMHQTSGTIVFDHSFWLFFYILCSIDKINIEPSCQVVRNYKKNRILINTQRVINI